ncbi:MAG: glycine C-acetyltransferase [Deltaproteobacteria bacterium]|nr:glycine C-acetyltransferase [Deltaproteobacteria bacterium]
MMSGMLQHVEAELAGITAAGLWKSERTIVTPQGPHVQVSEAPGRRVVNLCANNYLGLSDHPQVLAAAREAIDRWGYGMSSVRFICGTQGIHKELEQKLSAFLGMEDTILYSSCFDANGGLFETLLGPEDAVISDALNHASIIDGIRLCKAQRFRYANNDMADLETQLQKAAGARFRLIATDGVFSMDGTIANLQAICDFAERYDAMVMVDDSHATGFMGRTGRGTPEFCGVMGRVDIITSTLGKALGGAAGGFVSANAKVVALLRQRSRPYLFSNALSPIITAASVAVVDMLSQTTALRDKLASNTKLFREGLSTLGFNVVPGEHPIVPLMLGEAKVAQQMAALLLERGVYVVGFFYPVVPQGKARIRVQVSAAHEEADLRFALEQMAAVKSAMA